MSRDFIEFGWIISENKDGTPRNHRLLPGEKYFRTGLFPPASDERQNLRNTFNNRKRMKYARKITTFYASTAMQRQPLSMKPPLIINRHPSSPPVPMPIASL
jgi:hypothetical protein